MKQRNLKYLRTASVAVGLLFLFSQTAPWLSGQTRNQLPGVQQPDTPQQQELNTQTFVGKMVKAANGQFALITDEQNERGAYVDDQERARQFEGKTVKVTGVLLATNVIHITDIEPA